jgi:hypothetical protein
MGGENGYQFPEVYTEVDSEIGICYQAERKQPLPFLKKINSNYKLNYVVKNYSKYNITPTSDLKSKKIGKKSPHRLVNGIVYTYKLVTKPYRLKR